MNSFLRTLRLSLMGLGFRGILFFLPPMTLYAESRIISTSPQLTEFLFQLGLGERIVGTPNETRNPKAAQTLKKIGLLFNPNLEMMIKQNPTWVIWDESSYQEVLDKKIRLLGISTLRVMLKSPDDIFNSGYHIAKIFPIESKLENLEKARVSWNEMKKKSGTFSFVVLTWAEPPILSGSQTFLYRFFEELGGKGLLPAVWNQTYPKISQEWLISQKPDFVFYLQHNELASEQISKKCQKWWPNKDTSCIGISSDSFARASLTPFENLDELKGVIRGHQ